MNSLADVLLWSCTGGPPAIGTSFNWMIPASVLV